jgi:uncharacterized protein
MNYRSITIIAASIIIASLILGIFFYAARVNLDTVRVVGYATNAYEADIIKWSFNLSALTSLTELEKGYKEIHYKLNTFLENWDKLEIETSDFNINPVSVYKNYGEYGKVSGYTLEQRIFLVSDSLDRVEEIAIDPAYFVEKGITFEYSKIEYFSSHLPDIKQQLLAAATIDARERAQEIVEAADSKIKKMRSARAGVFQITEPYSTDVSGYGIHQTSTRNKNIKVTVTAEFIIK